MADWRHFAACLDEDPELFFPVGDTGPALKQIEDARAVCNSRCPVVGQCLAWALETNQGFGVWGGMSEGERRNLKRTADRAGRHYGHDVRAAAVKRFEEVRVNYTSDTAACIAVAEEFGIARHKTVLAWTSGSSAATEGRRPGKKPDLELRAHAVALVGQLRPHHRSERAACAAAAARTGVSEHTIGSWVREARAEKAAAAMNEGV